VRAGESDRARIQREIRDQIASGTLAPGQKIPSTSTLAAHYGVHMRTAAAALAEMKAEGVIYARQGRGYYVSGADPEHGRVSTLQDITREVEDLKARVTSLEQRDR
jgi:DNA-binding GntR family transcriptional regulator